MCLEGSARRAPIFSAVRSISKDLPSLLTFFFEILMGTSHSSGLKEVLSHHVREKILMPKKIIKQSSLAFRQCANRKSRNHPDVQCPCPAVQGDYCARHVKHPVRFQPIVKHSESDLNLDQMSRDESAGRIQRWWRVWVGIRKFFIQGPAHTDCSLAENTTELFSFDDTQSIPSLYRWSYADDNKHIWLFDIRSLHMSHTEQTTGSILNPYTRDPLSKLAELSFHSRCKWLRDRKYCLTHCFDTALTPEQIWHQTILDMILKYDMLGYHICIPWFEELHILQLQNMYMELWDLWFYRLTLQANVKEQVVPGWRSADHLLFKVPPSHIHIHPEKRYWQRIILELMDRLVSSAAAKEHKILGALYGMTAFAIVSPHVRNHYPWLVQ